MFVNLLMILLGCTSVAASSSSSMERDGAARRLENPTENVHYTSAELHIAFANAESSMNPYVEERFVEVCEDFIYNNLRLPMFGIINFDVTVSAQALLDAQRRRNLQQRLRRVSRDQNGSFLALNAVVGIEYSHPDGETVDPSDFHRYLRLLVNTRGGDLINELKGTGESYFRDIHMVGTHSSTIKVESYSEASYFPQETPDSVSNSGLHPGVIAGVVVAVGTLVIGMAGFAVRRARLNDSRELVVYSTDQSGPFTMEELTDILGDASLSFEDQHEMLLLTQEPHNKNSEEDSPGNPSISLGCDLAGAESILDELESCWGSTDGENSVRQLRETKGKEARDAINIIKDKSTDQEHFPQRLPKEQALYEKQEKPEPNASRRPKKTKKEKKEKREKKKEKDRERKARDEAQPKSQEDELDLVVVDESDLEQRLESFMGELDRRVSARSEVLSQKELKPIPQDRAQHTSLPQVVPESTAATLSSSVKKHQPSRHAHQQKQSPLQAKSETVSPPMQALPPAPELRQSHPKKQKTEHVELQQLSLTKKEDRSGRTKLKQLNPPKPEGGAAPTIGTKWKQPNPPNPEKEAALLRAIKRTAPKTGNADKKGNETTPAKPKKKKISRERESDALLLQTVSTDIDEEKSLSSISESDTDSSAGGSF